MIIWTLLSKGTCPTVDFRSNFETTTFKRMSSTKYNTVTKKVNNKLVQS